MRIKSRFLRILLIGFVVILFAGYFAFSTFLFSPTEGAFEASLATLMPRDADFYVEKANLSGDVTQPFPRLSEWDRIESTKAWQAYAQYDLPGVEAQHRVSEQLQGLAQLQETMRGINPLSVFGGSEISIAGEFGGSRIEDADWAAYGRVNWMGKLGVALLKYPGLIGLDEQGIAVDVDDPFVTLSGAQLPRSIHLTRIRDVVVAGTSLRLVQAAADLAARGGENSFGQGALYYDNIETSRLERSGSEAQLYLDYRAMTENMKLAGSWPDTASEDFVEAFLGRLFQLGLIKSLLGVVDFQRGVQAELHGEISAEFMTAFQKRFYSRRGFENATFAQKAARLARADTSFFMYLHGDVGDLLTEIIGSLEPEARANIEDLLRSTGQYSETSQLVNELDTLLRGRMALIVRPNDYTYDAEKDPPNDGRPSPAWSLVFWVNQDDRAKVQERVDELHNLIVTHQSKLGLQGRNPGERGVFTNKVEGGYSIWEFWQPMVTGTGHFATVFANDFYIISNSYRMLGDVLNTYMFGGPGNPRLAERPDFRALVNTSLPQANLAMWINPRTLGTIRRQFAQRSAEDRVSDTIDWNAERARIEDEVLRDNYPGKRRGQLDEATQAEVNLLVNPRIDELEQKIYREEVPKFRAALERSILYSELATGVLLMLALDARDFDLSLRAMIPLDE